MNRQFFFTNILIAVFFFTPAQADDKGTSFKEYLEQANSYIKSYRHFEASDALNEATKIGGAKHPSLHMRLGILYYGLGLIPEAIEQGERAVHLAPASKWYKYDLAKFYYVDRQFKKAEQQFITLLKIDPGFTLAYYYLAELYFQQKQYDMAWLSMQRAYKLGYNGQRLESKIGPLSLKPVENLESHENSPKLFRFIKLSDARKAQEMTNEIWSGKLFENLELELKRAPATAAAFGIMALNELKPDVAASLRDKKPYSRPLVIQTGPDYRIMQRILPFNPATWQQELSKTTSSIAPAATTKQEESSPLTPTAVTIKTTAKEAQISDKLAAFYALEAWKDAWQAQDSENYFSAYSQNFSPNEGVSRGVWRERRTRSIYTPRSIQIIIDDPVVEMLTDDQLLVTFKQSYTSDSYHDVVIKTLTMEKEESGWKISREREIKVIEE